jgi:hypothetical protein
MGEVKKAIRAYYFETSVVADNAKKKRAGDWPARRLRGLNLTLKTQLNWPGRLAPGGWGAEESGTNRTGP